MQSSESTGRVGAPPVHANISYLDSISSPFQGLSWFDQTSDFTGTNADSRPRTSPPGPSVSPLTPFLGHGSVTAFRLKTGSGRLNDYWHWRLSPASQKDSLESLSQDMGRGGGRLINFVFQDMTYQKSPFGCFYCKSENLTSNPSWKWLENLKVRFISQILLNRRIWMTLGKLTKVFKGGGCWTRKDIQYFGALPDANVFPSPVFLPQILLWPGIMNPGDFWQFPKGGDIK